MVTVKASTKRFRIERTARQFGEKAEFHRAQNGFRGPETEANLHDVIEGRFVFHVCLCGG